MYLFEMLIGLPVSIFLWITDGSSNTVLLSELRKK